MKNFIYQKAFSFEEALRLLSQDAQKAKVFAGGTDLLPLMKQKLWAPDLLIDLKGIPGAGEIDYHPGGGVKIGGLATMESIETSAIIRKNFRVLADAAGTLGSSQVRHRATLGGNLCHASPAAEMAPSLIALGARVGIIGSEGERWIPLEEFFVSPGETALQKTELLTSVRVPPILPRTGCAYLKHSIRKAMDPGIVNVAALLTLDAAKEKCLEARIVLGAVAPTVMRARKAEDRLKGKKIDAAAVEEAARLASEEARPITDVRASAEYRREMVEALTAKCIEQALMNLPAGRSLP
jgi:aerobic carbon-monoxide dehydrogenase medium subunit